jgi:hypothetical protein
VKTIFGSERGSTMPAITSTLVIGEPAKPAAVGEKAAADGAGPAAVAGENPAAVAERPAADPEKSAGTKPTTGTRSNPAVAKAGPASERVPSKKKAAGKRGEAPPSEPPPAEPDLIAQLLFRYGRARAVVVIPVAAGSEQSRDVEILRFDAASSR